MSTPQCCKRIRDETLQSGFGGQDRSVLGFACSRTTGEVEKVRTWAAKARLERATAVSAEFFCNFGEHVTFKASNPHWEEDWRPRADLTC